MILAAATALAAFPHSRLRVGRTAEQGVTTYTVVVRDRGVDAAAMERQVVEPLESELGAVPDMVALRSVAEDGVARVWLQVARRASSGLFGGGTAQARAAAQALAVRDAVDRVAEQLPASAERPEVRVRSDDSDPVYVLVVDSERTPPAALARLLVREVQPSFAAVDGVGRAEVAGLGVEEVLIEVDAARAVAAGLRLGDVAEQLTGQSWTGAGGTLDGSGQSLPVAVAGRVASIEALRELQLELPGGGAIALEELATIRLRQRDREHLSRVNGAPAISIAVFSGGDASLVDLSRQLRGVTAEWRDRGLPLLVVRDTGATLARSLRELAVGVGGGVVANMLLVSAALRSWRRGGNGWGGGGRGRGGDARRLRLAARRTRHAGDGGGDGTRRLRGGDGD